MSRRSGLTLRTLVHHAVSKGYYPNQQAIANAAGITLAALGHLMRGESWHPRYSTVKALAAALRERPEVVYQAILRGHGLQEDTSD